MKTKINKKNLGAYSALAVVFIAAGEDVHAQVVYTDVEPDYLMTEASVSPPEFNYLNIDFNNDAVNELLMGFGSSTFNGTCYRAGSMSFYVANYASLMVSTTIGGNKQVKILNEAETISASGNWDNYLLKTFLRSYYYMDDCDTDIENAVLYGNWNNVSDKYAGIRFSTDGGSSYNYGWVRMSSNVLPDSGDAVIDIIEVVGYAYEQTANTPINAGAGYIPQTIHDAYIEFNIYPNPAQNYLIVNAVTYTVNKLKFKITDIQGRNLSEGELNSNNSLNISVRELSAGLYILNLFDKNEIRISAKEFVKQ
ncbi:MAG: T9SS type A sorting domain-containing protein [Fimbriimonadaceae bacterium]|nr:T9SS type A sorting domain-containing protein [Chitinophagales bacterium]